MTRKNTLPEYAWDAKHCRICTSVEINTMTLKEKNDKGNRMFWELPFATAPQLVLTTVSHHSSEHRIRTSRIHVTLRHPTIFLAAWMVASHMDAPKNHAFLLPSQVWQQWRLFTKDVPRSRILCSVGVVMRVGWGTGASEAIFNWICFVLS